ncbi:hypothetical protein KKC00_00515 [Patescibacteria group bacterium]|nr:hypothetical protein [Patescibacteria group bacterium]
MSFLTQGKTCWKYIWIVVVLAIIVSGGSLWYAKRSEQPYQPVEILETEKSEIAFLYSVKGCAESDQGMAIKELSGGIEQEAKIEVLGNQIKYSRAIDHLCCRKADIEKEKENSIINIYEVWSGIGCKCMCFSEIEAILDNIPIGNYTVNVYEKGTQSGDNNEPMEQKLIISRGVDIK